MNVQELETARRLGVARGQRDLPRRRLQPHRVEAGKADGPRRPACASANPTSSRSPRPSGLVAISVGSPRELRPASGRGPGAPGAVDRRRARRLWRERAADGAAGPARLPDLVPAAEKGPSASLAPSAAPEPRWISGWRSRALLAEGRAGGAIGSPRVHAELRAKGSAPVASGSPGSCGRPSLAARRRRAFRGATAVPASPSSAPNGSRGSLTAPADDRVRATDTTYLATGEGWLDLGAVVD